MSAATPTPPPDLEGRPINLDEFEAYTPEKFELVEGYLFERRQHPERRERLLRLLLINVGLVDAVRMAPEELWRDALRRAYKR